MKLSESYSCPALNEAHLQAQTVRSLSLSAVQTYTDTPPRGPSLMRNSSGEISSIPFGTNMHPKVWAFCISLFSKKTNKKKKNSIALYICHGFAMGPRQTYKTRVRPLQDILSISDPSCNSDWSGAKIQL